MVAAASDDDAAAMYNNPKYLCFACHTKTAAKNFDPAKPDAELVQTILKGKKSATPPTPPNMPAFEETKGMTAAQAQSLVTYMKSLRSTPAATPTPTS